MPLQHRRVSHCVLSLKWRLDESVENPLSETRCYNEGALLHQRIVSLQPDAVRGQPVKFHSLIHVICCFSPAAARRDTWNTRWKQGGAQLFLLTSERFPGIFPLCQVTALALSAKRGIALWYFYELNLCNCSLTLIHGKLCPFQERADKNVQQGKSKSRIHEGFVSRGQRVCESHHVVIRGGHCGSSVVLLCSRGSAVVLLCTDHLQLFFCR